ncbi:PilZ domain-containing protein [Geminicoccus roseus]|uniref:PilZ domain-containing protein n=1 Tax=Geminicoccus roseus TaxID=404900 RepID=UPI0004141D18|nr:PilZ domain-containing protein [Geminicoccus roseus]
MSKLGTNEPVVHEAEIHRQHVRLKVPIRAEIGGAWFQVDDWSLGGIGIDAEPPRFREGEVFPVTLSMPFEDFELILRLEAEMVYRLQDRARFGCRFTGMTKGQISLFRQMVDRYLTGEIASPGDVLVALGRESFQPARPVAEEPGGGRAQRAAGWLAAGLAGLALVSLLAWGAYERFYRISTVDARIDAPVYRVTAPVAGRLERLPIGEILEVGTPIARVIGAADLSEYDILSPCLCTLGEWKVADGSGVAAGATAVLLISADQPLKVTAMLPIEQATQLAVGTPVRIDLPGEPASRSGQIERIDLALPLDEMVGARSPRPGSRFVPVVVRPDEPLAFDLLGTPVSVELR